MYKNLLVPLMLDHKGLADLAVETAQLLRDEDGSITLLHVMEGVPDYIRAQLPQDALVDAAADAVTRLKAVAASAGIDARVEVIAGHPGRGIVDFAKAEGINCIVVASHRPGLQDYFIGSTAAFVVRHAGCAVHVMR